jgi:hypothetical protein
MGGLAKANATVLIQLHKYVHEIVYLSLNPFQSSTGPASRAAAIGPQGSSFYANFGGDGTRLFRNDDPGDNVCYKSRT